MTEQTMSKEQIEEMAKDLCDKQTNVAVVIVGIDDEGKPRLARSARYLKNLIDAGWHKQIEGEWKEDIIAFCNVCSACKAKVDRCAIKCNSGKLNFCPNCGAKMKGGAE